MLNCVRTGNHIVNCTTASVSVLSLWHISTKYTNLTLYPRAELLSWCWYSVLQHLISSVRCMTPQRGVCVCVGGVFHNKRIGRQPSFLANLWASLPACPAPGALPETDGSRNVLERSSEELLVTREAREGGRGARCLSDKLLPRSVALYLPARVDTK